MEVAFRDETIDQIRFDFAVSMLISDGTVIRLESPFDMARSGTVLHVVADEVTDGAVTMIVNLLHRNIERLDVSPSGELRLRIGDVEVRSDADADFEAWTVNLPDGRMLVASPGGGFVELSST